MKNEGFEQGGAMLKCSGMETGHIGELVDIGYRKICKRIRLEISPQVFDGVQFRCVGWKKDPAHMRVRGQEVTHEMGSMRLQAVPDHHERRTELAIQLSEKRHGAPRVDIGVAVQTEVQAHPIPLRRDAQRADHAHFAVRAGALANDGCRATWRPGAPHQRRHQKRGFVDEDQPGFQTRGVFFTRGQSDLTQVAIAVSSRSKARRVGFCGLQPKARIKRPIWSM